jgi:hypothetical protein
MLVLPTDLVSETFADASGEPEHVWDFERSEFVVIARRVLKRTRVGAFDASRYFFLSHRFILPSRFYDLYDSIKADENSAALTALPAVLKAIDAIADEGEKIETLIDQVNAGNMFDWGAVKILEMLRSGELDFASAKTKLIKTPKVGLGSKGDMDVKG